jgi:hypothetical protein
MTIACRWPCRMQWSPTACMCIVLFHDCLLVSITTTNSRHVFCASWQLPITDPALCDIHKQSVRALCCSVTIASCWSWFICAPKYFMTVARRWPSCLRSLSIGCTFFVKFHDFPLLTLDHMVTSRTYVFYTVSRPFLIAEHASFWLPLTVCMASGIP